MSAYDLLPLLKEASPSVNEEKLKSFGLVATFFVLSVGLIAGSAFYYLVYEKRFHARMEEQLSAIAELKVYDLAQWRKERMEDASIFYQNSGFAKLVKHYFLNPNDDDARDQLQNRIGKFAANRQYDGVLLLDNAGNERMHLPDKREPATAHFKKDISEVFHSGSITFLDFHLDTSDGAIHLALLVPIFENNRPLSVLVLRIDPSVYLYPYIQKWPIPSKTSETLIARREGNTALFLNELKFQRNTALRLRIPLEKLKRL